MTTLRNVDDIYPLSPMQGLMLAQFLAGSDPELLVNQARYEIRGPLKPDPFREAWEMLVARHASLRTAFLWDGLPRPVQVVRSAVDVPFQTIDLSDPMRRPVPRADEVHRLEEVVSAARPIELAGAPLMRCTLVRLADDHHVFLWTVHHLVVDRWSHGTLFAELATVYDALLDDRDPDLPPAPGYRDYVAWLEGRDEDEAEHYWTKELEGFDRPTPLGAGAGPVTPSARRTSRRTLGDEATSRLRDAASAWRSTLAAQVLTAIAIEVARRNRSSDGVFGLTVSGRPADLDGVEQTVGSFVNNVPLRIRFDRAATVSDLVRDVQRSQLRRLAHEHLSPAAIRDVSGVPAHLPLFDTLVVLNLGDDGEATWSDLEVRPLGATFDASYPLVLGVSIEDGSVQLTLVHDADFEEADDVLEGLAVALEGLSRAADGTLVEDIVHAEEAGPARPGPATEGASASARDDAGGLPLEPGALPLDLGELPLDRALVEIWRRVLGRDQVGLDDDFFELGGTSLQALQILRRMERRAGRALSISTLFGARTVRGLLARLGQASETGSDDVIRPAPRTDAIPLSFSQERLWALDRIEGESAVYNLPVALRLSGPLDTDRLRAAIDAVIDRHEVLRTRYPSRDGSPFQAIEPPSAAGVTPPGVTDRAQTSARWTEIDAVNVDADTVRSRIEAEAAVPFDLAAGPLFRTVLFRLTPQDHVLLLLMHHSVGDAWSVGVLLRDLTAAARALPGPPEWPELRIQYADFAVWQRERLQSAEFAEQLAYWRDRLDGTEPLDLPTDRPRPAIQSFAGAIHRLEIGAESAESLRVMGRREGSTLFMTLMAALHVLLHRYTGQSDITVGTPYAGRGRPEVDDLIGMFVNTLLIRTKPVGDMTFRELLALVRDASIAAHERQDVPFERLVETLQPERDLSRHPLFQVMFALQDSQQDELDLPDVRSERYDIAQDTSKFDLTLYLRERTLPGGRVAIEGLWEYAADLFAPTTIERMQRHFENLLDSIAADPSRPISALTMLDEDERRALVGGGATEAVAATEGMCDTEVELFLPRFDASVRAHPERVAIVDRDARVTYGELDARANRLAHRLIALGAAPEVRIGIGLERSADLVVAMLAVLRSGAAYVPLDPEYPAERLAYMLEDAEASLLVTTTGFRSTLPTFHGEAVCLDRDGDLPDDLPETAPGVPIEADQLAYTIYTSGSTGRPKGVDVTHGNLAHFLAGMIDYPGLSPNDVVLARTTPAFDPSVVELLGTLVVGARMVIARTNDVNSGERLKAFLDRCDATLLQATPATFSMLFEAGWLGDPDLRILVGGESLSTELAARLTESCREVWNIYGPTEGTVWATAWRVGGDLAQIRVGTAIGDRRLLVLDEGGNPVPVGVRGELYVGGGGVTRGYRNRPQETAHAYVPDPFSHVDGARLFRTGDLVRFRDDGTLEFFGRADHQVKVRGFRIELGEIEGVLVENPDVRRAVVTVVDAGTPDARLIGYVVLEEGALLTTSEIRRYLRERLPNYMIPGLIVEMEAFPLTPSGKVDRGALPDPTDSGMQAEFVSPSTPAEKILADVWSELLEIERVGRFDNFYQLGGHSLLSLRAVAIVADRHGHSMDPRAMFFQTLAQLAEQMPTTP